MLAATLTSHQAQYIKTKEEMLLPKSSDPRQWRRSKLEDGDLSRPVTSHSELRIQQVKVIAVERSISPSSGGASDYKASSDFSDKRPSNGPASDAKLRSRPSGIGTKHDSKQRQRERRTHQREARQFIREHASKTQSFAQRSTFFWLAGRCGHKLSS